MEWTKIIKERELHLAVIVPISKLCDVEVVMRKSDFKGTEGHRFLCTNKKQEANHKLIMNTSIIGLTPC